MSPYSPSLSPDISATRVRVIQKSSSAVAAERLSRLISKFGIPRKTCPSEGIEIIASQLASAPQVEVILDHCALVQVAVGRDRVIADCLGAADTGFARCTIDHLTICLSAAIARNVIARLLAMPVSKHDHDPTVLRKMSDGIEVSSFTLGECNMNVVSPIDKDAFLDEFIAASGSGGVQHIALLVSDIASFVRDAEDQGIPTLREMLLRNDRRSPDDKRIAPFLNQGYVQFESGGSRLRQTFVFPSDFPEGVLLELIQRDSFSGYSEENARALFDAMEVLARRS